MHSSIKAVIVVLSVVGVLNLGYAGWIIARGGDSGSAMACIVAGLCCAAIAAVLGVLGRASGK